MGGRPRGRGAGHTVCQGAGAAPSGGHRTARTCWAAMDVARATLAAADAVRAACDFATPDDGTGSLEDGRGLRVPPAARPDGSASRCNLGGREDQMASDPIFLILF